MDQCTHLQTQYLFTPVVLLRLHNSFEKLTIVFLLEQLKKLLNCYFVCPYFISLGSDTFYFSTTTRQRWSQRRSGNNCPKCITELCWIVCCYWPYSSTTTTVSTNTIIISTTVVSTTTTTTSTTITIKQPGPQWSSVFIQQPWNTRCLWHLYFMHTTIIPKWFFF